MTASLIIDADSHVTEPPGVWTERVPARFRDDVPHVERIDGMDVWLLQGKRLSPLGVTAPAGWPAFPPEYPPTLEDCHPGAYDADARLRYMDEAGIWAQVLYPNVGGFGSENFLELPDEELKLVVRAGVQRLPASSGASAGSAASAPGDRDAVLGHDARPSPRSSGCAGAGHRGVLFTGEPQRFGLPILGDHHWDPLWAVAQDAGLPIHFHIGNGGELADVSRRPSGSPRAARSGYQAFTAVEPVPEERRAVRATSSRRGRAAALPRAEVRVGRERDRAGSRSCSRRPTTAARGAARAAAPPASCCRRSCSARQVYVTYWFEQIGAHSTCSTSIPIDHVLFETDFPHTTCLYGNIEETIDRGLGHVARRDPRARSSGGTRRASTASTAPPTHTDREAATMSVTIVLPDDRRMEPVSEGSPIELRVVSDGLDGEPYVHVTEVPAHHHIALTAIPRPK